MWRDRNDWYETKDEFRYLCWGKLYEIQYNPRAGTRIHAETNELRSILFYGALQNSNGKVV